MENRNIPLQDLSRRSRYAAGMVQSPRGHETGARAAQSRHRLLRQTAYQAFNDNKMTDYIPTDAELARRHRHTPESPRHGIRKRYDNSGLAFIAEAAVVSWVFQIDTAVFAPEAASGSLSVIAFWNEPDLIKVYLFASGGQLFPFKK